MSPSSSIQIESKNGCLWILMPRFINSKNNLQLQDTIEKKLSDVIDRVVLDFTNVASITSLTIGLLMRLREITTEAKSSLYLINIPKTCFEQLETVNLDKIFPVLA